MVNAQIQQAISQRYAQLANSITHGERSLEASILSTTFRDRSKIKLSVYEYDPLTVLVQRMNQHGSAMLVKAYYVGVHGRSEVTFDRWLLVHGSWRLMQRDASRR